MEPNNIHKSQEVIREKENGAANQLAPGLVPNAGR